MTYSVFGGTLNLPQLQLLMLPLMKIRHCWCCCAAVLKHTVDRCNRFSSNIIHSTGVARILSGGVTFLHQEKLMTFLVIALFYIVMCAYASYTAINPSTTFLSHLRGCTSPNLSPFCLISTKMSRTIFFHRPGGAPAPPAPSSPATPIVRRQWEQCVRWNSCKGSVV